MSKYLVKVCFSRVIDRNVLIMITNFIPLGIGIFLDFWFRTIVHLHIRAYTFLMILL